MPDEWITFNKGKVVRQKVEGYDKKDVLAAPTQNLPPSKQPQGPKEPWGKRAKRWLQKNQQGRRAGSEEEQERDESYLDIYRSQAYDPRFRR